MTFSLLFLYTDSIMRRFGPTLTATVIVSALLMISPTLAADAKSIDIPLWENGAPGANGKEPKDCATWLMKKRIRKMRISH